MKTMPHSGIYAKAIRGLSERFYVVLAYDDKAYHSGSVERFLHFEEEDAPA